MSSSFVRHAIRAAISAGLGLALCAALVASAGAQTFKIGAICSLTGPAAGFGKPYCDGFEAYLKYWNSRGGAAGKKVELLILDDETNGVTAVNAFRRLADNKDVSVVWLGISSNSVLAIKPLASEAKIPIVASGAADSIGVPADPYLFKVVPGAVDFIISILEWARKQGVKSVASINATDAYGQSEAARMKELAPKYGIRLVAQETFAVSDTNFTAQLVRIRSSKPDMVYSGATGGPAVLVYQQYKQLGLSAPIALSQGALNPAFFQAIGGMKAAEGILSPTNQGTLGAVIGGEAGKQYQLLVKWLGQSAMVFNTFGWDHGIITEWAIVNSDASRGGIRAALDRAKEVPGINGPFNFRPDYHVGQDARGLRVAVLLGGKFVNADKLPGK